MNAARVEKGHQHPQPEPIFFPLLPRSEQSEVNTLMGIFRKITLSLILTGLPVFLGCSVSLKTGIYDSVEIPGWVRYEDEGASIFRTVSFRDDRYAPSLEFYGEKKGGLNLTVQTAEQITPLDYEKSDVQVLDANGSRVYSTTVKNRCSLIVPIEGEFSVSFPAVKCGKYLLPNLVVKFHWSDRGVMQTKHIFGS